MQECSICCEAFSSKRTLICCINCNAEFCSICVKHYLLESTQSAHCMACKHEWNNKFLHDNLTKSFIVTDYRKSRQRVSLEKQKSLLPQTLPFVEPIKKKYKLELEIKTLKEYVKEMQKLIRQAKNKIIGLYNEMYDTENKLEEVKDVYMFPCPDGDCRGFIKQRTWKCGLCEIRICKSCHVKKEEGHKCNKDNVETARMVVKDTKPCPTCKTRIFKIEGCFSGDTNIQTMAGIKNIKDVTTDDMVIGEDNEPKKVIKVFEGEDRMYHIGDITVSHHHTLVLWNNGIVEIPVFKYLSLTNYEKSCFYQVFVRDGKYSFTKMRPLVALGKQPFYGITISGESHRFLLDTYQLVKNCNQMFCTQCHTAFDWVSGKIETGIVHNPHYFELQKKLGGAVPRNNRDVPCGGLNGAWMYSIPRNYVNKLLPYYQRAGEIITKRGTLVERDFLDIRLDFLIGKIACDSDFRQAIFRRERQNEKLKEERQILETYISLIIERFRDLTPENVNETRKQMEEIRQFCNDAFTENYTVLGYKSIPQISLDVPYM